MTKLATTHYLDLVDGKFKRTSAQELDALFRAFDKDSHNNHLVVHFHGGLVGRDSGEEIAKNLLDDYERGGGYPVFFIWNSDLKTTLVANLKQIAEEDIFKRLVRRVAQYVMAKLGEGVSGKGADLELPSWREIPKELADIEKQLSGVKTSRPSPLSDLQMEQFRLELEDDNILNDEIQAIVAGLQSPESIKKAAASKGMGGVVRSSSETLMSQSILAEAVESQEDSSAKGIFTAASIIKHVVKILAAVIKRCIDGRDHGLYTTVVEEILRTLYVDNIGGLVWNTMKTDTEDAFRPEPVEHGGTAFLEHLKDRWRDDLRVTLIGHSTGAIFITNFLREADKVLPPEARFDVIFLAAASSFPFMHEHLDVYRKRVKEDEVRHIRAFGLSDEIESNYFEIPFVYKGSLLYLVSGLLEDEVDIPIVGMERYFSGKDPYDRDDVNDVRAFLDNAVVWSPGGNVAGRKTEAKKHGEFDNDDATIESIVKILRDGF